MGKCVQTRQGESVLGNGGGSAVQNLDGSQSVPKWVDPGKWIEVARARRGSLLLLSLGLGLIILSLLDFPHAVRAGTDENVDETVAALSSYIERHSEQSVTAGADQADRVATQTLEGLTGFDMRMASQPPGPDWLARHKLTMSKSLAAMEDPGQAGQVEKSHSDWLSQHRQAVSVPFTALADYVRQMGSQPAQPDRSERPLSSTVQPLLRLADRAESNFWKKPAPQTKSGPTEIHSNPTATQGDSTKPLQDAAPEDETRPDPWSYPNATYVGAETCMGCHFDKAESFSKTLMGRVFLKNPRTAQEKLGCEGCHGPGSEHVAAGGGRNHAIVSFRTDSPLPLKQRNDVCLGCHEDSHRTYWTGSQHQRRGLACTNCHQVHQEHNSRFVKATEIETCFQCHKDKRAKLMRFSRHPLAEGKMECSSCHNPHGSPNPKLLVQASVNETCYQCHADKRGPFLWEHAPVRENCATCHDPHGTSNFSMLKTQVPRLCQQCHAEPRHPSEPQNPLSRFAFNRGCTNCHGAIHGSNSPSGVRFQR